MPNLVILNAGPDTAGVGIALKRAFDKHTDWNTRSIAREVVYLDYPTDIVWPYNQRMTDEVWGLVANADVIHVMDSERALLPFRRLLRGKMVVVQHLGTHFRRKAHRIYMQCRTWGVTQVTDSIDLVQDGVAFLPTAADTEALAQLRADEPHKRIRISHAPTNRAVKSTEQIIAAVAELSTRYPISFDLIEGVSNAECLARKARTDIFVDQLTLGFGVNAIECWAMGIPVVSGLVDEKARARALAMWGQFPWADARPETLVSVIEHLIVDKDWRKQLAQRGLDHVQRWHSEQAVVEQTLSVYGRQLEKVA